MALKVVAYARKLRYTKPVAYARIKRKAGCVNLDGNQAQIGKNISVAYRMGQIFYDGTLLPFHIGCGQQFFLLKVAQNPGITLLELAQGGCFDKGTTARAVRKLEEEGYICVEGDPTDRRFRKLYATPQAEAIIAATEQASARWQEILTQGMTEEERALTARFSERMAENAYEHITRLKGKKENEWNK